LVLYGARPTHGGVLGVRGGETLARRRKAERVTTAPPGATIGAATQ
jgi:hypothetical protein